MASGPRRPTITDIAAQLGLSQATVSRALRGHEAISAETRARVRAAARALNYVPNVAARSLVGQASRTLGLIVPDMTDPFHSSLIAAFGRMAATRGYAVMVLEGARDADVLGRNLATLTAHQADGVAACGVDDKAFGMIDALAMPSLLVVPETRMTGERAKLRSDDTAAMIDMCSQLVSSGRKRFGYLAGPAIESNRVRLEVLSSQLAQAGLPAPTVYPTGETPAATDFDALAAAARDDRIDALVCYDDQRALHMLDALRQAAVRVPAGMALTGFDGTDFAALSNPRLTTVSQPAEALGSRAASSLCDTIETDADLPDEALPATLIIRESSGGPLLG